MNCQVIIDCGATSTKIACIHSSRVEKYTIQGFNPQHGDWDTFQTKLKEFFIENDIQAMVIEFYGAGLSSTGLIRRMKSTLGLLAGLDEDHVDVYSDLYACAIASYGGQPIVVGILGTGSNAGCYDGHLLSFQTKSLGYLLGDEGSATDIGKRVLKAYVYKELPDAVHDAISRHFNLSHEAILKLIYEDRKLRSLAGTFSKFMSQFADEPCIRAIIYQSFNEYVRRRLSPEIQSISEIESVHMFGAVAVAYEDVLRHVALSQHPDIRITTALSPLDLLIERHISK